MKRSVAIICLFVIMFQSMSTLYIYCAFYFNRNYISENICVNRFDAIPVCKGQCYLAEKLTENEKQENKFPELKQKEIQLFFEQAGIFDPALLPFAEADIFRGNTANFRISNYAASVFHPPQTV